MGDRGKGLKKKHKIMAIDELVEDGVGPGIELGSYIGTQPSPVHPLKTKSTEHQYDQSRSPLEGPPAYRHREDDVGTL